MNKILVPTDFSENANNALRYAINIANYFDAEIQLLHVFQTNSLTGDFDSVQEYMSENAERNLSDNIRLFKTSILRRTILKGKAVEGSPIETICSVANHDKVDLIVMGTQGASGLREIFLGSKTSGVMKGTKIPILAIPSRFKYRPIKDIIFAIDSGIVADSEVLNPLLEIAKAYRSQIKVLHLETQKMMVGYDPGIEVSLEEIPHTFHRVSGSNDVNGVVNLFVFEENSDMLCMIRRERSFWEKLFHRSVTKKEIFDSPVPFLVLHSED